MSSATAQINDLGLRSIAQSKSERLVSGTSPSAAALDQPGSWLSSFYRLSIAQNAISTTRAAFAISVKVRFLAGRKGIAAPSTTNIFWMS